MKIGNLEVYGIIYKITNKINGKAYIGQTTHKKGFNGRYCCKGKGIERIYNYLTREKSRGVHYNKHLLGAINAYGFNSFEVSYNLDIAFSRIELNIKEKTYIKIFDSFNNGYNNCLGGDGINGLISEKCVHSKPVIQYSLDGSFINVWNCMADVERQLGLKYSKISACCLDKRKSHGGFIWKYKGEEITDIQPYSSKIGEYNKLKVVQLSLIGDYINTWNSLSDASRGIGIVPKIGADLISRCCQHKNKTALGFVWVYENEYRNSNFIIRLKKITSHNALPVVQFSLDDNYIGKFISAKKAAERLGKKNCSHICSCCKNDRNSAYGYKWMYYEEYIKQQEQIHKENTYNQAS